MPLLLAYFSTLLLPGHPTQAGLPDCRPPHAGLATIPRPPHPPTRPPAVKGSRSLLNMCPNMACQPLSAPREAMMSPDPMLKHSANLAGARMRTGRKRKKARRRKSTPVPKKAAKYTHCVRLGRLLGRLQAGRLGWAGGEVSGRGWLRAPGRPLGGQAASRSVAPPYAITSMLTADQCRQVLEAREGTCWRWRPRPTPPS